MRSTTLAITLLLASAALVSTAALPSNPSLPDSSLGSNPSCNRIDAQASSARSRSEPTDTDTNTNTNTAALPPPLLAARDPPIQPSASGVLRGNQRSDSYALDPGTKWNVFWCSERAVIGGTIALWQIGPSFHLQVELAGMGREQLRIPFRPMPGSMYAVELKYPGPSMFSLREPVISWYFATQ